MRHSGRSALAGLVLAGAAVGQAPTLALDLRDGSTVVAEALTGDAAGFEARVDGRRRRIAARDLLAVRGAPARASGLMCAELAGGDLIYGALAGGDATGDRLELLSPVLGKVAIAVDRLSALVQPGVEPSDQLLPDGVDEAVFLTTGQGYDVVAGTLHRFGSEGVRFEPEAADGPQWFSLRKFSALRLRGALPRPAPAPCTLLTRTADRLGVRLRRCGGEGLLLALEDGTEVELRWPDLGCLVFHDGVVHLSDLVPTSVVESGYDGPVVYPWRRDRSVAGGELLAMGRPFGRGLGAHGRSQLAFEAPADATHLWLRVAVDDSAAELPIRAQAEVRVLVGGKLVFEAADLTPGQPPRDPGLLPVNAGDTVTLEVDFGPGRDLGDRVDWLLPVFLLRSRS